MNKKFYAQIRDFEKTKNALQKDVHETYEKRHKNPSAWNEACERFHTFTSPMEDYLEKIYENKKIVDPILSEFGICFLETDALFFRSGYIKAGILKRIKRSKLDDTQLDRLRKVLMNAVKRRGFREYRYYCRLAIVIANRELINFLLEFIKNGDKKQKSRAKLMFETIKHNRNS